MDDIGKLILFRDVVDAGGFSHAAARRGLSHSTVSKHVKSLEEHFGVLLLNRTSRSMSLTEAGRLVLGYSRKVGVSLDELHERVEELRGEVVGELRVASLVHVGRDIVQPAVASYLAEFPRARVRLVLDDGPLHFNRDGFDLAVRVGLHVETSLTATKLAPNDVCVCASPELVARRGMPRTPDALADYPVVGYHSPPYDITAWPYRDGESIRTVEVDPICRVNDGRALLELVLAGVGAGYLSEFSAREHLASGALVRVMEGVELVPFEPVFVFQATTDTPSMKVREFRRHLRLAAGALSS